MPAPPLQDASSEVDEDFRSAKAKAAFDGTGLDFVYPYGATLSVQAPAVPILSSGKIAYPMNRPLGACAAAAVLRACGWVDACVWVGGCVCAYVCVCACACVRA